MIKRNWKNNIYAPPRNLLFRACLPIAVKYTSEVSDENFLEDKLRKCISGVFSLRDKLPKFQMRISWKINFGSLS